VGEERLETVPANKLMESILGNTVYSNVFLLGYAWQRGLVPVTLEALLRAIELNGVNVTENQCALDWGRLAAEDRDYVTAAVGLTAVVAPRKTLDELIEHRSQLLVAYQREAYAQHYRKFVARVREREQAVVPGSVALTEAVAKYLYKLMAYKDEYEVARLYTDGDFRKKLAETFEGDYRLTFHLAPPVLNRGLDAQGRPRKSSFGPWMLGAFKVLARLKVLRGTVLDPFGWFTERREERALIGDYRALVEELLVGLTPDNHTIAVDCASLPDQIRGYGPVKAKAMSQYYALREAQLHRFHNPASVVQIQEVA
jgi:indolepyruvate ferredoxin oxidoreductase